MPLDGGGGVSAGRHEHQPSKSLRGHFVSKHRHTRRGNLGRLVYSFVAVKEERTALLVAQAGSYGTGILPRNGIFASCLWLPQVKGSRGIVTPPGFF